MNSNTKYKRNKGEKNQRKISYNKENQQMLNKVQAFFQNDHNTQALRRASLTMQLTGEVEGMTAVEIAEALQTNVNTIYGRLRAARQRFARLLRREQARDERRKDER